MEKQVFNPYLPSLGRDRLYIYSSHDLANGWAFCLDDYVCLSCPINDLKDLKNEGIIYKRQYDPAFNGKMALYAQR